MKETHRESRVRSRKSLTCDDDCCGAVGCGVGVFCCDDANCKLPLCCRAGDGSSTTKARRTARRRTAKSSTAAKTLIAGLCALCIAGCALCMVPGVVAGGGGGDLRPGFVICEEHDGEEHCETDYAKLEQHCSELDTGEYDLGLHIGAVFIQIGVSFIGCMVPIIIRKWKRLQVSDFVFSLFKHFGAGIILATGFIHMFPPAYENLTNVCLSDTWLEYPFASLFAMLAIILTQFIQTMAVSYLKTFDGSDKSATVVTSSSLGEMEKVAPKNATVGIETASGTTTADGTLILDTRTDAEKDLEKHATTEGHGHDHGHSHHKDLADLEHTHNLLLAHKQRRQVTVYILEIGIATHSFIIGLALGVSRGSEMTALMIALAFHQFFEGMALSATALDAGFKTLLQPIFLVIAYSLTTPLGIAVGIGIESSFQSNSPSTLISLGVIDAVAAGILIYDACVNLVSANMTNNPAFIALSGGKKALSFGVFWLGVALMSLIGKWA